MRRARFFSIACAALFAAAVIWSTGWCGQVNDADPQFIGLGDFNGDGTVDAADYVVWRKGLGT
jgi:hypothetical protein